MERRLINGNSPYEALIGFSHAVRVGDRVLVSGTTATGDDGSIVGVGDPYMQTVQTLKNIQWALEQAGATLADVVRTRMCAVDIAQWPSHRQSPRRNLRRHSACNGMLEGKGLISPEMLVKIEAEAVVGSAK